MYYCTLDEAKAELSSYGNTPQNTVRADDVMRAIRTVTRRINKFMAGNSEDHYFAPQIKARQVPISAHYVDSYRNTLMLKWPLLALTAVDANGSVITSNVSGYPSGEMPYQALRANSNVCSWYSYINCEDAYAEITGVWGYHGDYANAWLDTGLHTAAEISGSATSFKADAAINAENPLGFAPILSRGALVRFGTGTDYAILTSTNHTKKEATMQRNALGGTGDTVAAETSIYVWQVEEPIKSVTARQAGLMLARRGAYQTEQVDGITLGYPPDLLNELASVLSEYINGY